MDAGERKSSRSSKNKKGGKAPQVRSAAEEARRREVLKEALREKLELERRALQVVERLLDDSVAEEFLIDCARMITLANYKDAVEERFIVKMCGYPVCPNKLTKYASVTANQTDYSLKVLYYEVELIKRTVPAQQFKISTKTNKVYDITERKCFCSNFCYKASKYFEVQISKSPLWLRKEERPPDIKLMKQGDGGSSGLEVKLTDKPVTEADIENPVPEPAERHGGSSGPSDSSDVEQDFVSSVVARERPKARVHWGNLPKRDGGSEEEPLHDKQSTKDNQGQNLRPQSNRENVKPPKSSPTRSDLNGSPPVPDRDPPVEETRKLLDQFALSAVTPQDTTPDVAPDVCDANSNTEDAPDTNLNISHVGMSKKSAAGLKSLLKNHRRTTAEALPVTRSLLEHLRITLVEWRTEDTMRFLYGPDYTSQTEAASQSEEEEELDEDDLKDVEKKPERSAGRQARPTAAAPDYETLRKETEQMDLRVQEFYKGVCVLPEETGAVPEHRKTEDVEKDPPLPPVDSHAQGLIQKRIAVEKLSRSLRDIVGPLHVTMSEIINDINNLVRTFRCTNVNIIHKPPEWTLLAVVLLSVLTEVSPLLKESMASASSVEYISSLMKELRLKEQDLQRLIKLFQPSRYQIPSTDLH